MGSLGSRPAALNRAVAGGNSPVSAGSPVSHLSKSASANSLSSKYSKRPSDSSISSGSPSADGSPSGTPKNASPPRGAESYKQRLYALLETDPSPENGSGDKPIVSVVDFFSEDDKRMLEQSQQAAKKLQDGLNGLGDPKLYTDEDIKISSKLTKLKVRHEERAQKIVANAAAVADTSVGLLRSLSEKPKDPSAIDPVPRKVLETTRVRPSPLRTSGAAVLGLSSDSQRLKRSEHTSTPRPTMAPRPVV